MTRVGRGGAGGQSMVERGVGISMVCRDAAGWLQMKVLTIINADEKTQIEVRHL